MIPGSGGPLVNVVPMRVGPDEARRIASNDIFAGYSKPEDIRSATLGEAVLYYLPVWRISVEMAGFHLGIGSLSRRGPLVGATPDLHARQTSYVHVLAANRSFPIVHVPFGAIRAQPEAMIPGDAAGLPGAVPPVDVWQVEAEREAVAIASRAVASNRALISHFEPRLWTALGYWPIHVVRYAYEGSGRRHYGEEYFVTVCGRSGGIIARHHPAGVGLFGALGRFLGVNETSPAVYAQPPVPPRAPPPPAPPPPAPPPTAYVPPPPAPPVYVAPPAADTSQGLPRLPRALDPSQVLAVTAALSLSDARSRIAEAIRGAPAGARGADAPSLEAPHLIHMPLWRMRLDRDAVLGPRSRASLPAVFAEPGAPKPRVFLVTATRDLPEAALPLAEIGGFHTPDVSPGAIAVASRASLEVGAFLLDNDVSRDAAAREVVAACAAPGLSEASIESALLVYYPVYVQRTGHGYVVLSARSGAVLGARHRIALTSRASRREISVRPS